MEGPGMLLKPCIDNTNYKVFGSISPFKSKPPAFHSILSSSLYKHPILKLVGGFNPFQIGLFPQGSGWKKYI